MSPDSSAAADRGALTKEELVRALRGAAGSDLRVSLEEQDLMAHARDYSGWEGGAVPWAVAYPRTTAEVSAILAVCNRERVPVIPQGGLTGLVGGALPSSDALVLSLQRMSQIEEIDRAGATLTAQAGVALQRIQQAAEQAGFYFPLDLGARGSCAIGGNIATNAGGNRVLRYGMARDLVLGLEAVLADGTVVSSMNRMLKNNAGYDLKHLFIGSEGTLGVVTRAVLRLFPAPRGSIAAVCAAKDYEHVLQLLDIARSRLGGTLSAFEVMWKDFYELAVAHGPRAAPVSTGWPLYVLMEALYSNDRDAEGTFGAVLEEAYARGLLVDAALAKSNAEINSLWAIRDFSGELDRHFGRSVGFDISIPVGQIAAFVAECDERLKAEIPQSRMLVFGHIADSNIHLACRASQAIPPRESIERIVYGCVGRWRGSISAEHGIGLAKREYLPLSRSAPEIALMRLLKSALDPNQILNPGKVIPD